MDGERLHESAPEVVVVLDAFEPAGRLAQHAQLVVHVDGGLPEFVRAARRADNGHHGSVSLSHRAMFSSTYPLQGFLMLTTKSWIASLVRRRISCDRCSRLVADYDVGRSTTDAPHEPLDVRQQIVFAGRVVQVVRDQVDGHVPLFCSQCDPRRGGEARDC